MNAGQSYPSPNATQVNAGSAGLFVNQNGDTSPGNNVPTDPALSDQLSAELSRSNAPMMTSGPPQNNVMSGPQHTSTSTGASRSPTQLAQGVMNYAQESTDGQYDDPGSNQRKRSKVSRACDECRRKKIRCDATSENGPEACSSCKRTAAQCQFSRQPLKRGPSKGYIKELADRLHTLEHAYGHGGLQQAPSQQAHTELQYMHDLNQSVAQLQEYTSPPGGQYSRKRKLSVSEDPYGSAGRQSLGWPNGGSNTQFWNHRESISFDDTAVSLLDWDEPVLEEYFRVVHVTFPLLSGSKILLQGRLAHSVPSLRLAFLAALDCAVRSSPLTTMPRDNEVQNRKRVADLITSAQVEETSPSLLYLQALVLMAIDAINLGPLSLHKSEWLGRAISVASSMRLFQSPNSIENYTNGNPDSDEKLRRRTFWVIAMLDRWHAVSTSSLVLVPESACVLLPEERLLLGDSAFHLARFSMVIGHIVEAATMYNSPSIDPSSVYAAGTIFNKSNPAANLISIVMHGELLRVREDLPSQLLQDQPVLELASSHVHLLLTRLSPKCSAHELLQSVRNLVNQFSHSPLTFLSHHCAALAAVILGELLEHSEVRDECRILFDQLDDVLSQIRGSDNGWEVIIREFIMRKKTSADGGNGAPSVPLMGLQHLADAAMGERIDESGLRPDNFSGSGPSGNHGDVPATNECDSKDRVTIVSSATQAAAASVAVSVAQATANAAAAQLSMNTTQFDPATLIKYGYLNIIVQDIQAAQ